MPKGAFLHQCILDTFSFYLESTRIIKPHLRECPNCFPWGALALATVAVSFIICFHNNKLIHIWRLRELFRGGQQENMLSSQVGKKVQSKCLGVCVRNGSSDELQWKWKKVEEHMRVQRVWGCWLKLVCFALMNTSPWISEDRVPMISRGAEGQQ